MASMTVEFRNVDGTEAALGWAGVHTIVVDRPVGKAGGRGLGFNGGQLLALAIGGCFCNDLRYLAHDMDLEIARLGVDVTIDLEGDPLIVTAARTCVDCEMADGSDPAVLVRRAEAISTVSNSLAKGVPVSVGSDG